MHPTLSHAHAFARVGERCAAAAGGGTSAALATALVLVNTPTRVPDFLRAVWAAASCVVVADGAANRLLAALGAADAAAHLPDLICGDLDSLTAPTRCVAVLERVAVALTGAARRARGRSPVCPSRASATPPRSAFYEGLGVPVEQDPDQDTTDLQKCMGRLKAMQEARGVVRACACARAEPPRRHEARARASWRARPAPARARPHSSPSQSPRRAATPDDVCSGSAW